MVYVVIREHAANRWLCNFAFASLFQSCVLPGAQLETSVNTERAGACGACSLGARVGERHTVQALQPARRPDLRQKARSM